ncbi:glycosyltransferase family 4 protein [Bacteriovoracales bacterium]|nr:glycosyltransferase family 4 protein [Bacteriovoracales bacterium]
MKILVWNECYTSGGADWSLIDLVESWPDKNDSFLIYINETHEGLNLVKEKTKGRAEVKTYKSFMERVLHLRTFKPFEFTVQKFGQSGKIPLWLLAGPLSLLSSFFLISKKNCDVLILNNGGYPGGLSNFIMAFWATLKGIKKRYMIVRNYPLKTYETCRRIRFFKWFSEKTLVKIITVSNSLKDCLQEKANIKETMLQRIYNGINIENKIIAYQSNAFSSFSSIEYKVGIIGNLEERKGHDTLFQAWASIITKYPKAKLFVFASSKSGDKKKLVNLAKKLNISHSIVWFEFMKNIGEAYKFLDVVVMPSKNFESFGRIIVEAMAFGKPIIASNIGGMPELIENEKDGILFEAGNVQKLTYSINKLLESKELRKTISSNGTIKYHSYYTSKVMAQNYYDFINNKPLSDNTSL